MHAIKYCNSALRGDFAWNVPIRTLSVFPKVTHETRVTLNCDCVAKVLRESDPDVDLGNIFL